MRIVSKAVELIIMLIIICAGFATAVLELWNWLMPKIFGLHAITYWQALGLMGLCWLLFGGPRAWFRGGHRMHGRWQRLTPEERERFRAGMRGRCGHAGAPVAESKA